MSLTSILDSATSGGSTSTLMLSPCKQRGRPAQNAPTHNISLKSSSSDPSHTSIRETATTSILPSEDDIYKWTLKQDAVAPCFIKDVLEMKNSEKAGELYHVSLWNMLNQRIDRDFFWLGRVPCRTVRLVSMVVGVEVYEKKTMYTRKFLMLFYSIRLFLDSIS
jgi:hypothetical protein